MFDLIPHEIDLIPSKAAEYQEIVKKEDTSYYINDNLNEDEKISQEALVDLKNIIVSYLDNDVKSNKTLKKKVKTILDKTIPSIEELVIFIDIIQLLDSRGVNYTAEIFKGAHIRIEDNGELYERWANLKSARKRISSHPSIEGTKQYGIEGPWVHELLFGVVEVNGVRHTFFQFENTPWSSGLSNRVGHATDAIEYFFTNKNIGPYGTSEHTDRKPIQL